MDLELITLDEPTETRRFEKGPFDVYKVGPGALGRVTHEPRWKWSAPDRSDVLSGRAR
jgi:hypothetical protein